MYKPVVREVRLKKDLSGYDTLATCSVDFEFEGANKVRERAGLAGWGWGWGRAGGWAWAAWAGGRRRRLRIAPTRAGGHQLVLRSFNTRAGL